MKHVIILNATELGYQVIRALGEKGIQSIVIYDQDKDEIGRYSKYVDAAIKIPGFIENPDRLLDFLLTQEEAWHGNLIIPTKDYTVEFLARHKEVLSRHYLVPTPDLEVVERVMNKRLLYDAARKLGIAVPRVFSPRSLSELDALKSGLRFPCLIKPGLGHLFFRKYDFKMIEVDTFPELSRHYRRLTDDFTHDDFHLTISEIIPGPDSERMVQYVSYLDRSGERLASMTSRKIRQDPPRYGQGRVVISERIGGLDDMSVALLKALGYYGFSEIEWKYDVKDRTYKLIEINPRFIFYIGLCTACGINFPYMQYLDLVEHRKIGAAAYRSGVYWIHLYKDVLHTLLHHRMERISLRQYVAPYLSKKTFAVLDRRDFRPFYHQWKQHLSNMVTSKIRRNLQQP